ncbi:hypothetical protein AAE478_003988 [Parahypoxylon ruwenzoriense]
MDVPNGGEKLPLEEQDSIQSYLAPLDLPPDPLQAANVQIVRHEEVSRRLASHMDSRSDSRAGQARGFLPAVATCSGGLLQLFPYFFVDDVYDGLHWSFFVSILALFIFGFIKDYLLHPISVRDHCRHGNGAERVAEWERIQEGSWGGMWMAIMGGIILLLSRLFSVLDYLRA